MGAVDLFVWTYGSECESNCQCHVILGQNDVHYECEFNHDIIKLLRMTCVVSCEAMPILFIPSLGTCHSQNKQDSLPISSPPPTPALDIALPPATITHTNIKLCTINRWMVICEPWFRLTIQMAMGENRCEKTSEDMCYRMCYLLYIHVQLCHACLGSLPRAPLICHWAEQAPVQGAWRPLEALSPQFWTGGMGFSRPCQGPVGQHSWKGCSETCCDILPTWVKISYFSAQYILCIIASISCCICCAYVDDKRLFCPSFSVTITCQYVFNQFRGLRKWHHGNSEMLTALQECTEFMFWHKYHNWVIFL